MTSSDFPVTIVLRLLISLLFASISSIANAQTTSISAVLQNCTYLSDEADEAFCAATVEDFIGDGWAASARASRLIRQLSWASKSGRIPARADIIAIQQLQRSSLTQTEKRTALSELIDPERYADLLQPTLRNPPTSFLEAMHKERDGFEIVVEGRGRYTILSTYASADELCRIVGIETQLAFSVDALCKVRGGEWQ